MKYACHSSSCDVIEDHTHVGGSMMTSRVVAMVWHGCDGEAIDRHHLLVVKLVSVWCHTIAFHRDHHRQWRHHIRWRQQLVIVVESRGWNMKQWHLVTGFISRFLGISDFCNWPRFHLGVVLRDCPQNGMFITPIPLLDSTTSRHPKTHHRRNCT